MTKSRLYKYCNKTQSLMGAETAKGRQKKTRNN